MIEKLSQVIYESSPIGAALCIARVTESSMVEGDDFEVTSKKRHLVEPRSVITAEAMGEDQRRAVSVNFVIKIGRHLILFPLQDFVIFIRAIVFRYYEEGSAVNAKIEILRHLRDSGRGG